MMDELLRLTRENNEMLAEILRYVRKVDSQAYRDSEDFKAMVNNIVSDMFANNNARQIMFDKLFR